MRNHPLAIRLAGIEDIPALQAIEISAASLFRATAYPELAVGPPISRKAHEAHFAKKHPVFVAEVTADEAGSLAECRSIMAGFALVAPLGKGLHLHELSVHADHQHRGIGRSLLRYILAFARQKAFHNVTLTTYSDIAWNAAFYRSEGFSILQSLNDNPALETILQKEIAAGAKAQTRCAMRHDLA